MTSPVPISVYYPVCSYCWKASKKPIFFVLKNNEEHWACSEKCKKELIKNNVVDIEKSLLRLKEMYLSIFLETKMGKSFRKVEKISKSFYEEKIK